MQISKCFLIVCASACCTFVLPLWAADTDADAKLREALRQKIAEMQAQPTPPPAPAAVTQPVPKPAPAPPPATPPPPAAAQPAPAASAPVNQESIDKARATLHQQMVDLESQPPAATAGTNPPPKTAESRAGQKPVQAKPQESAGKPEAQKKAEKASKPPALAPIPAPPPGISADKGARLAELLKQYKEDKLTPEEYHRQRAKILSEP